MKQFIKINEIDNVVVALQDFKKGTVLYIDSKKVILLNDINRGHKIAINNINVGEDVIKYGFSIGIAKCNINIGEVIHTSNIKTKLSGKLKYTYKPNLNNILYKDNKMNFKGYKRKNGSVGIRNELWVVPTVGCVNETAQKIVDVFVEEVRPKCIDAVQVMKHNYGCSQLGNDHINTRTILGNLVKHPNAGAVLVLGLGCENNNLVQFIESLGEYDEERILFLEAQSVDNEIEEGVKLLKKLYYKIKEDKRVELPISKLNIGLKCGGSDGLSGITANPLLGAFSDYLIVQGGSTILTEVPEMFGAEIILMERAEDEYVFNKIVKLINDFKDYYTKYNQPIYENPSPGNKAGGITTLEEKSLGCIQKGGESTIVDVLKYGEILKKKGLNLLSAPGNDLVASTALAASGCQMVLFTTGRGTPVGTFVPTIKISTNTQLYNKKLHWIDFNAGDLVENQSISELLYNFIDFVIKIANGKCTNNEKNNFREISIFKTGVTL